MAGVKAPPETGANRVIAATNKRSIMEEALKADWKKKFKERVADQFVTLWGNHRPLRLMFQDEARFGRIADTRVLFGAVAQIDQWLVPW